MFILDSLMISGLRWVLDTVVTAADAEMNDDTALREQLLEAEMRREMGEIGEEEFREIEADRLRRIREIKERREGGAEPLAFGGAEPIETSPDSTFHVEATVSGDFHDPADAPHTTVIESEPRYGEQISVLDIEPGQAEPTPDAGLPLSPPDRTTRLRRAPGDRRRTATMRQARTTRTARTVRTARAIRTRDRKIRKS